LHKTTIFAALNMRSIFKNIVLFSLFLVMTTACSQFQKILKSDDVQLKYSTAKDLFDKEEYQKAVLLFEDILPYFRVSSEAELLTYMHAYCHFAMGNFTIAASRFKILYHTYPFGKYAEQSLFNYAYCAYMESPPVYLDQSPTKIAIESFQYFIDRFPASDKLEECNKYIDEMYNKLEQKEISIARLYYKLEDYRSAIFTLSKVLEDYPLTENRAELSFMAMDAHFKLALNSIDSKKLQRFEETIAFYNNNKDKMENTKYAQQAANIVNQTNNQINKLKNKP